MEFKRRVAQLPRWMSIARITGLDFEASCGRGLVQLISLEISQQVGSSITCLALAGGFRRFGQGLPSELFPTIGVPWSSCRVQHVSKLIKAQTCMGS